MTNLVKNKHLLLLLSLLLLGCLVRFYRVDNPVADWHSWRQADTSAVSRNFVEQGFDLLHPRMNNISNVQSGVDNPQGYFFAEFPIFDATQAGLFVLFGMLTLEEWGRIVSIFTSVLAGLFLYLLVRRHSNRTVGLFSLFFYLFIPYDIYYGRVILPDPSMVMATLGGIYFFDRWTTEKAKGKNILFYCMTTLFFVLAFLLKPVSLFFVLPLFILAWNRFGWKLILRLELWLFVILSIAPLLWWRWWVSHYPEGIPNFLWLLNKNGIRFRPSFFRWIFYERLTKLISGYVGIIFVFFGSFGLWKNKKERIFFLSFIASSLIYLFTVATGNVQHDYYQIPIMPTVAFLMAFGAVWLITFLQKYMAKNIAYGIVGFVIFLTLWIGWQIVQPYFDIDNPSILAAGKAIQQLTPKNAKILANYNGDSSLLYQMDRQGWANFEYDVPTMHKMGADYLVLVNPVPQDMAFAKQYKVIAYTKQYVIFDLRTR